MRPTPSSQQRKSKPSTRRRRPVTPAGTEAPAAAKAAVWVPASPVTSGMAYFTFSDSGELIITSYELAAALWKMGGEKLMNANRVKIGVYAGTAAAQTLSAGGKPAPRSLAAARKAQKLRAAGQGTDPGYTTEDDPQLDSMCMCDVKC